MGGRHSDSARLTCSWFVWNRSGCVLLCKELRNQTRYGNKEQNEKRRELVDMSGRDILDILTYISLSDLAADVFRRLFGDQVRFVQDVYFQRRRLVSANGVPDVFLTLLPQNTSSHATC